MPGSARFVAGRVQVNKKYKIVGNSQVYLTLRKNSLLINYVCQDGKAKVPLVPDSLCRPDLCKLAPALCKTLETPGLHNREHFNIICINIYLHCSRRIERRSWQQRHDVSRRS